MDGRVIRSELGSVTLTFDFGERRKLRFSRCSPRPRWFGADLGWRRGGKEGCYE